jgi:hypothetical protein
VDRARLERVDVERHVNALGAVERRLELLGVAAQADGRDVLALGRVEAPGPEQDRVLWVDRAGVEDHPQGHPPEIPGRGGLGGVQVAVCVEPDERDAAVARGQRLDRADVRAAATAEHERTLREVDSHGKRLLVERVLLHHRGLGERERQTRGLRHRLAPLAPGLRHAHHPRPELPPAGVALVAGPDRDARVRAALRATGSQATHSLLS